VPKEATRIIFGVLLNGIGQVWIDDVSLESLLPHRSENTSIAQELLREDIIEVMAGLSPRERDVLRLRFGLDDGRQRTLEEVGELFGITREGIRKIEAAALRKLRHPRR